MNNIDFTFIIANFRSYSLNVDTYTLHWIQSILYILSEPEAQMQTEPKTNFHHHSGHKLLSNLCPQTGMVTGVLHMFTQYWTVTDVRTYTLFNSTHMLL